MKKIFFVFIVSFLVFAAISPTALAVSCAAVPGADQAHLDTKNGLVPCGQFPDCRCELSDVFGLILRLYNFMVWVLMPIIVAMAVVTGGVFILLSGLNSGWYDLGKKMIFGALTGGAVVLLSWLIIDIIFRLVGYTLPWNSLIF